MKYPLVTCFSATERGGSDPSTTIDLLGQATTVTGMHYAGIKLESCVSIDSNLVERNGVYYIVTPKGVVSPELIAHENGFCYRYHLGPFFPGDGFVQASPSKLRLFEDGKELSPAHSARVDISQKGKGAFLTGRSCFTFRPVLVLIHVPMAASTPGVSMSESEAGGAVETIKCSITWIIHFLHVSLIKFKRLQ
jgi:hypothetical protein